METIIRNATNRFIFSMKENPVSFSNAVAIFKQGGRIILWKDMDSFAVDEVSTKCGKRWNVSVDMSAEESRLFNAAEIGFAQIVAMRDYGVQDPGEIVEFEVQDTLGDIDLSERRT